MGLLRDSLGERFASRADELDRPRRAPTACEADKVHELVERFMRAYVSVNPNNGWGNRVPLRSRGHDVADLDRLRCLVAPRCRKSDAQRLNSIVDRD